MNVAVDTKFTERQSLETVACPLGDAIQFAGFPEIIRPHVQYGDSVSVLAGLPGAYGAVSASRIHVLLGCLMGVALSTGTIVSMTYA